MLYNNHYVLPRCNMLGARLLFGGWRLLSTYAEVTLVVSCLTARPCSCYLEPSLELGRRGECVEGMMAM